MASLLHSPSRFYFINRIGMKTKNPSCKIFARFNSGDHESIFKAAVFAASIRFQESIRPDPLFIDPYAGCFLSSVSSQNDGREQCPTTTAASSPCYYSLTTKFIDDKLLSLMNSSDELRQMVWKPVHID